MAGSATLKLAFSVFICVAMVAPLAEAAISCDVVGDRLAICGKVGQGVPGSLEECCSNIGFVLSLPQNQADRQALCACVIAYGRKHNIDWAAVARLARVCGKTVFFPLGPDTDCSKVK
ncbi:hypothetical protein Ancab_031416 [Ancistrocladus abbreviatus]